jgi:hypothetical protein
MLWNQRSLRVAAALALTVVLAGPMASAGASGFERMDRSRGESSSFMDGLWAWVRSFVSALSPDGVTRTVCSGDRGAGLDPNGCGTGTGSGGETPPPVGH